MSLGCQNACPKAILRPTPFPRRRHSRNHRANPQSGTALDGVWLRATDATQLDEAVRILRKTVPQFGTNMHAAWDVASRLSPPPDNIILFADGLPTMDDVATSRRTISGGERARLFDRSLRNLPSGIPVNVLLYPLEGDYQASIRYWMLAYRTGGSYIAVSRDWP